MMLDTPESELHPLWPAPAIRGYKNLYGCSGAGNEVCDGSVSHVSHHLSVCLPVCHPICHY